MQILTRFFRLTSLFSALLPLSSLADTVNLDAPTPSMMTLIPLSGQGAPSASFTSPNALGSGYSVFINANRVTMWTGSATTSGGMDVGANFGDAHRYVSGTVYANLSTLNFNNSFLSDGAAAFRINRYFDQNTALAIGMGNAYAWGNFKHTSNNYYAALTHVFPIAMPVTLNGGFGTGSFNGPQDFQNGTDGNIRPFLSVGFAPLRDLSLIADYTAKEVSLDAVYSFNVLMIPFFANIGVANVASTNGGAADFQCGLGAAYLFAA